MKKETRRHNFALLVQQRWRGSQRAAAEALGITEGRLSQLLDPNEPFGEKAAENLLEKLGGLPPDYFDRPIDPADARRLSGRGAISAEESSPLFGEPATPQVRGGVAHLVTRPFVKVRPPLNWEELVLTQLPAVFDIALPDDAMGPDAPAGSIVTFSTALTARSGQGVLVVDKDSTFYFRIFKQRTASHWVAEALNANYLPLDSIADGLRVLAVMQARRVEGSSFAQN